MKRLILATAILTVGTLVQAQEPSKPGSDFGHRWMRRSHGHRNDRRIAARGFRSPGQFRFFSERADRPHSLQPRANPSKFHYQGKEFESFQAFKESADYAAYRLENEMAAARFNAYFAEKEERRQAAVQFEVYRRKYRVSTQFWMDQNTRMTALARSTIGESRWNRLFEPQCAERPVSVQSNDPGPVYDQTVNRPMWVASQ